MEEQWRNWVKELGSLYLISCEGTVEELWRNWVKEPGSPFEGTLKEL